MTKIIKFVLSLVICEAAGSVGGWFTAPAISGWYQTLDKPSWTPAGSVIGTVWTILYFLMGIALYLVWARNFEIKLPAPEEIRKSWNKLSDKLYFGNWRSLNVVLVFGAQLALNISWSAIFFGARQPGWAFFELLALWVAVVYTIVNFYRVSRPAAFLLLPYILWVTFAGYLNYLLWRMN
jgi:translocator protein